MIDNELITRFFIRGLISFRNSCNSKFKITVNPLFERNKWEIFFFCEFKVTAYLSELNNMTTYLFLSIMMTIYEVFWFLLMA